MDMLVREKSMEKKIIGIKLVLFYLVMLLSPGFLSKAQENSLTYVVNGEGEAVITGCRSVEKEITIPAVIDGYPVAGIGEGAFQDRTDIEKVDIRSDVRYIGEAAFQNTSQFRQVILPTGIVTIEEKVVLPESMFSIDKSAFSGCMEWKLVYGESDQVW